MKKRITDWTIRRRLLVMALKDRGNWETAYTLALGGLNYYIVTCIRRGRWLVGPRGLNIALLICLAAAILYDTATTLWGKFTGKD